MTRAKHVVTGHHDGSACPSVVAMESVQRFALVDMLLGVEPDPRVHDRVYLYVEDRPVLRVPGEPTTTPVLTCLRLGFHDGFGGAFFSDETVPQGADWAWVARNPSPLDNPPRIWHHQEADTVYPPEAVMPLSMLRDIALEWTGTRRRPEMVEWMAVNLMDWTLNAEGRMVTPEWYQAS